MRKARRELECDGRVSSLTGRGRGNLTLWTVHCLPEKGVTLADPFSADVKGVNPTLEKGSNSVGKRGQPQLADLRELDRSLNRWANPSSSLSRAVSALQSAVPDATEREIRAIVSQLEQDPKVRYAAAYLAKAVSNGDAPVLVAEARNRLDRDAAWAGFTAHTGKPAANGEQRPWCGKCSDDRTRQVDLDDGTVARCPDCHWRTGSAAS